MAERRMISRKIVSSARFLKMPHDAQSMYFHLILSADDDGVAEGFQIMRMIGASEDSLKLLVAKSFVTILNEDLVTYVTNWTEHNKIRADRKSNSLYTELLLQTIPNLELVEKKPKNSTRGSSVQPSDGQVTDNVQPSDGLGEGSRVEVRVVEGSRVEVSVGEQKEKRERFSIFDYFILEVQELFKEKRILVFKNKINATVAKPHFDKNSDYKQIAFSYTEYVVRNKSKAIRLDKYLIAYREKSLQDIEYGQEQPKSTYRKPQPQKGSIGWYEQQQQEQANIIDAEVE